jgi:hypothetical protein
VFFSQKQGKTTSALTGKNTCHLHTKPYFCRNFTPFSARALHSPPRTAAAPIKQGRRPDKHNYEIFTVGNGKNQ